MPKSMVTKLLQLKIEKKPFLYMISWIKKVNETKAIPLYSKGFCQRV